MNGNYLLKIFKSLDTKEKIEHLEYFFDEPMADEYGESICRVFIAFIYDKRVYTEPFIIELSNTTFKYSCVFQVSLLLEQLTREETEIIVNILEDKAREFLYLD